MRANYFLSFVSLRHFNFRNYFVDNKVIYTKTAANGERSKQPQTNFFYEVLISNLNLAFRF